MEAKRFIISGSVTAPKTGKLVEIITERVKSTGDSVLVIIEHRDEFQFYHHLLNRLGVLTNNVFIINVHGRSILDLSIAYRQAIKITDIECIYIDVKSSTLPIIMNLINGTPEFYYTSITVTMTSSNSIPSPDLQVLNYEKSKFDRIIQNM